jgi:EAL domain-containing protein (putative c-di-GMP-specific phosphodiesterase class I)
MGIRISLDDFGTGFSSLSHILTLPIDELKLDRTFIQDFDKDQKRQNVIQNIINLAHGMNIRVVAEGVESESEDALLKSYGCNVIQGYYHAMPMPLDEMIEKSTGLKLHPMAFKHKQAR